MIGGRSDAPGAVLQRGARASSDDSGAFANAIVRSDVLKTFRIGKTAELAVKGAERQVAGFSCDFENQAIGESDGRFPAQLCDRRSDNVGVLDCEAVVIEQHFHGSGDFTPAQIEDTLEHPRGFGKHQVRNPRAGRDKALGGGDLFGVFASNKMYQHIRISGAHDAIACADDCLGPALPP